MGKNFERGSDISPDVASNVGSDTGADFGGDLAGDAGVDLNAGKPENSEPNVNKHSGGTRAAALGAVPFAALAPESAQIENAYEEYHVPTEIHMEAPDDAVRTPEQVAEQVAEQQGYRIVSPETEDSNPSPLDVAGDIGETLREAGGDDPTYTPETEVPHESEYTDSPPNEQD